MHRVVCLITCALSAGIATARPAFAQDTTIGVGVGVFDRNEGRSDRPYLGPGYGGSGPSALLFYLRNTEARLTAGAEVLFPGTISGAQSQRTSGGENHLVSTHRDVVALGVAAFQSRYMSRLRLVGVVGGGFARRHTSRVGTFRAFGNQRPETPVVYRLADIVPAIGGGPNLVFAVSRTFGIVALARVHYLLDDDQTQDGAAERGVSSALVSFGFGTQVTF